MPAGSHQQTAALVADLHGDGAGDGAGDFVIGFRVEAPALAWFRTTVFTTGHGWHEGKLGDLDGGGDLDGLGEPYNWHAPRVDVWLNGGAVRNWSHRAAHRRQTLPARNRGFSSSVRKFSVPNLSRRD